MIKGNYRGITYHLYDAQVGKQYGLWLNDNVTDIFVFEKGVDSEDEAIDTIEVLITNRFIKPGEQK